MPLEEGTFIAYEQWSPNKATVDIIAKCNTIISEYEARGYRLTVRQIHYQGVSREWWPNTDGQYQKLIGILRNARMAGMVSWTAIEDRGRALMGHRTFEAPGEALNALADKDYRDPWTYRLDLWATQDFRPEVWFEKQALSGVIGPICDELRVDWYATKGHSSVSETWAAGQRLSNYIAKGQRPIIFYLGDHDPTGIQITEHVRDTLSLFVGMPIMVQRLALNKDQIDELGLPHNPVKTHWDGSYKDSRAAAYVEQFGEESWELDALEPGYMQRLVEEAVVRIRDQTKWDEIQEEETEDKRAIGHVMEEYFGGEE